MTIGNINLTLNTTISMLWFATNTLTENNHSASVTELPAGMVNSSLVIEIVKRIHQREELRNIVFYISHYMLENNDAATRKFVEDIWYAFASIPVILMVNNSNTMMGLLSKPSMCLIMTTQWNDPIMELAAESLKGVRYFQTIFLLFPGEELRNDFDRLYKHIRLIYDWSWRKQFLQTLLITIWDQIYLYEPFPQPSIINKTSDWHLHITDILADKKLNVKGMEIRTPVRFDIPRVFCLRRYPNKGRVSKLTGASGKIFGAFMQEINATFNDTLILTDEFEPFSILDFIKLVEDEELEISVHSYTTMINTTVGYSYPIGINDFCFMVPYRNSTADHMFLAKTFRPETFLLLCLATLYITLGIWLCLPALKRDFSSSFLQAICSLILISPLKLILLPYPRLRFLFILLFIAGFCITNLYMSKMASVLAAAGGQKQINTIQDILDAKLTIMMLDYELEVLEAMDFHKEFLKTVLPVDKPTLDMHREKLNTSYGYSVSTDRWNFINKQQNYLRTPIFRLTSICVGPYYHAFPLQKDSYLMNPLKEFIMAVSQSGYIFFWEDEAFDDALFLGYVQMIKVYHVVKPLTMTFFSSVWYLWMAGLCLGLLAFAVEVKGEKLKQQLAKCKRWLKNKKKYLK